MPRSRLTHKKFFNAVEEVKNNPVAFETLSKEAVLRALSHHVGTTVAPSSLKDIYECAGVDWPFRTRRTKQEPNEHIKEQIRDLAEEVVKALLHIGVSPNYITDRLMEIATMTREDLDDA